MRHYRLAKPTAHGSMIYAFDGLRLSGNSLGEAETDFSPRKTTMTPSFRSAIMALSLGLGACASAPSERDGVVYFDGSYYSPAAAGYGDYYYAPLPSPYTGYSYWYAQSYPYYYYDSYCSVRYRSCAPSGYYGLGVPYYYPYYYLPSAPIHRSVEPVATEPAAAPPYSASTRTRHGPPHRLPPEREVALGASPYPSNPSRTVAPAYTPSHARPNAGERYEFRRPKDGVLRDP